MNLQVQCGLYGRFRIVKHRNGEISQELEFDNLILNSGLERWGTGAIIERCQIGSGNTAPAVSDINLAALLATTTSRKNVTPSIVANTTSRWAEVTTCYRFDAGVGTGTIAEVGMGWSDGLWSRSLIKDGSGVPTTITKLYDETLDVYYTLRIQYPSSDITGSIVLEGVTYDYVLRPANIGSNPQSPHYIFEAAFGAGGRGWVSDTAIAAVDSQIGLSAWLESATSAPYAPGSKSRRIKYQAGLSYANVTGGFKAIHMYVTGYGGNDAIAWQIGFYSSGAPVAIPKTNAKIFSLTMDYSWARGS